MRTGQYSNAEKVYRACVKDTMATTEKRHQTDIQSNKHTARHQTKHKYIMPNNTKVNLDNNKINLDNQTPEIFDSNRTKTKSQNLRNSKIDYNNQTLENIESYNTQSKKQNLTNRIVDPDNQTLHKFNSSQTKTKNQNISNHKLDFHNRAPENFYSYDKEIKSQNQNQDLKNHKIDPYDQQKQPDNERKTTFEDHTTIANKYDGISTTEDFIAPLDDKNETFRSKEHFKMPQLFPSVASMFDEADKEIDEWRVSNQNLQQEIEQLQQLVRSLTQSAKDIHNECTKPREATLKVDPSVKLRVGNTRAKASMWERQVEDGEEELGVRTVSRGGSRRSSLSIPAAPISSLAAGKTTMKT